MGEIVKLKRNASLQVQVKRVIGQVSGVNSIGLYDVEFAPRLESASVFDTDRLNGNTTRLGGTTGKPFNLE